MADILRTHGDTDIAFIHSGGIRADLPEGPVTREDLLDAFPFIDYVYLLEMTGAQILDVLEQGFTLERGVLQVSGIEVAYDLGRPTGDRVAAVRVDGHPLEPDRTYSVTTLDFLASGADLYTGFTQARVAKPDGPEFADLMEARFAAGGPVPVPPRGRLIPLE